MTIVDSIRAARLKFIMANGVYQIKLTLDTASFDELQKEFVDIFIFKQTDGSYYLYGMKIDVVESTTKTLELS